MKTFRLIGMTALSLMLVPMFSSCGGDDDDDDGPDNPNTSTPTEIDGTRLTSVGEYIISYDSKGRPVKFYDTEEGEYFEINYSKGTISGFEDGDQVSFKLNSKGLLSELTASWDYTEIEDGEKINDKGTGKYTFNYKDNCLTSYTEKVSESYKNFTTGESYKSTLEETGKFSWVNGNLASLTCDLVEKWEDFKEQDQYIVEVDYTNTDNKFRQFPASLAYSIELFDDVFWSVGLLGNGPDKLPNSITTIYNNDLESTTNVDFSLNSNGSIKREWTDWKSWNYGYTVSRASAFYIGEASKANKVKKLFRLPKRKL